MADSSRAPRNIVVCCDGTGNRYGTEISNVVRLYTCLVENSEQRVYYHPGLGTMGDPRYTNPVRREVSKILGLAFGSGFNDKLSDAYRFLMDEYADGDHIFLFGFSRGAYTVRALAGALRLYGLLCKGNEGHLPYLLGMFSEKSRETYAKNRVKQVEVDPISEGFRESFSRTVPIHFMGIWDTVSSIGGLYDPVKLLYDGQNSIVRKARHAISLDERRCFFQANLLGAPLRMSETPVLAKNYDDPADRQQDIVQAWFAGVHADIGGSYKQAESGPAFDALNWILAEAEADGLRLNEEKRDAIFGDESSKYPFLSQMNPPVPPDLCLHESLTWQWWPLEFFPHKYFDQAGKKRWRFTPWPHCREVPEGALLHPSLLQRLARYPDYQPKNLHREHIKDYRESPVLFPKQEVIDSLAKDGYGVYRPKMTSVRSGSAVFGIAALFFVGLAGWLQRRPFR